LDAFNHIFSIFSLLDSFGSFFDFGQSSSFSCKKQEVTACTHVIVALEIASEEEVVVLVYAVSLTIVTVDAALTKGMLRLSLEHMIVRTRAFLGHGLDIVRLLSFLLLDLLPEKRVLLIQGCDLGFACH